jgi:hypothetical protein
MIQLLENLQLAFCELLTEWDDAIGHHLDAVGDHSLALNACKWAGNESGPYAQGPRGDKECAVHDRCRSKQVPRTKGTAVRYLSKRGGKISQRLGNLAHQR